MVDFDVDLGGVLVLLGIAVVVFILVGSSIVGAVGGFIDRIVNNPNRPTNEYDLTCETRLKNDIFVPVSFVDIVNGQATTSCYYKKSSLFSFAINNPFSLVDTGTLKMEAQGKQVFARYSIGENLGGAGEKFALTLYRLQAGQSDVTLTILDELGKPIDSRVLQVNIGG